MRNFHGSVHAANLNQCREPILKVLSIILELHSARLSKHYDISTSWKIFNYRGGDSGYTI